MRVLGKSVRTEWILTGIVLAVVGGGCLFLYLASETRGNGGFEQPIRIVCDKPIKSVSCCCWNVDDEWRKLAEETADPRLFDCDEARSVGENRFMAKVRSASRSGPLVGHQVIYPNQMVVYVYFVDGSRACRVIDMPRSKGKDEIVVQLKGV